MSNDDILSIVQELPLHVTLKLRRNQLQVLASPVVVNVNNEAIESGQSTPNNSNTKVPVGYNLYTVYLSSLETKCIMPCDLKECPDIEGLYKMQKSTLQIGEQDNLKKGDILYCINGDQLSFCNKFDLVSKLSNLNGIAEVSILRKTNNCYGTHIDQIPYHNGIFAQNSIKLAMRKYDKPSIKSNSEIDMANTGLTSSKTDIFSDEIRHSLSHMNDLQKTDSDVKKEELECGSQIFKATLVECKDLDVELNNALPEPIHNDNWLLYDKNSSEKIFKSSIGQSQKLYKTENSLTDTCPTFKESENTNPPTHLSEPSLIFDHGTARSFTSSSCHSERSLIHLNCAVCIEDEHVNSKVEDLDGDVSEVESSSKLAEQSTADSLPEYSIVVPKSENTPDISSKFISTCQIEIKTPSKLSNLKVMKPPRVTFGKENEKVCDKLEPLVQLKSTDLDTLIEDNFAVEVKDMTENDCDLNSAKITSQSSDYCKLSNKNLNDTDNNFYENCEKVNESVLDEQCSSIAYIEPKIDENLIIKSVLESIIHEIETQLEVDSDKTFMQVTSAKPESNDSTSSFGLKETFEQENLHGLETTEATKDDIDFQCHPDETSDTIIDELEIKDQKVSDSNFDCEVPRDEVIHSDSKPRAEAEPLNIETTLSRLLKSDSDSSSTHLKHSTQIGLNDTQVSSSVSIPPPAPPLPEKLVFSSISDISTIQNSFDQHKSLDRKIVLKNTIIPLKETSLPSVLAEKPNVTLPSSGIGTSIEKKEGWLSSENITNSTNLDSSVVLSKKASKWNDRFNSLITPRPFNSLKNSIGKQEKANNYCKTLMTIKKQNITFSKFFFTQTQALFNDKSIVSNRNSNCTFNKSIRISPKNKKKIVETKKIVVDSNSSNSLSGIITPKCTLPANLKTEKARKDELVIDYVESAFDKQIKQKTCGPNQLQSQSQTSSNPAISSTTLSGNGPVVNSLNINRSEIEDLKKEILKQASSRDISISSMVKEETTPVQELKAKFSVKEKIMLFTQNLPSKETTSKNKIEKPKIYESKLSKSILVTSTPSINDSLDSRYSINKPKCSNTSFNYQLSKQTEEKKLFPTLNKNFTSQPNISSIEKRPELIQSIIINDESITCLKQNDTKICDNESLQSFKSVRDKIAYFSSKVNKTDSSQNSNQSVCTVRKSNESINSSKLSVNSRLGNKIEGLNKVSVDSNYEDYDSLKHAYKLNSIANTAVVTNNLGKSCMNLKISNKEIVPELKTKHSSTSTLNVYNNSKMELKSFIYSSENKISDLIENIELKMKKN